MMYMRLQLHHISCNVLNKDNTDQRGPGSIKFIYCFSLMSRGNFSSFFVRCPRQLKRGKLALLRTKSLPFPGGHLSEDGG